MIELKHFRKKDLLVILFLAFLCTGFVYIVTLNLPYVFELVIFFTAAFATFTVLLIKRVGSVTFFFFLIGIMTLATPILGFLGLTKVLVLVGMGLIFEIIVYLLKKSWSVIPATIASSTSMPWLMFWLGQATTIPGIEKLTSAVWNFTIIASLSGLAGALIGLAIWYKIKSSKFVLRFELT